ncbi:hypothetical protein CDQ84_01780 [Clostridium thermosuccinogenes]|uniref:Uncharacterized protein n=1 Tax=Clostridium thermosuccinogenes TaxID=84032 RepID=A0A2K2F4B5_9CLOT|nr:hypothetical protein [Pseudoclostridium thermosuccinogenes]AUS95663.1 hypothetical protein CDO33_03945 [Pseudoclostridium thermosuccinogenes]PNT93613.1 hypothetical protein CDQ83_08985 [Pseudoclostridium thermosuccinogenes]PNT99974.1 hypothetical protein CDQ85_01780 [Pseudoclostridium thermosuccinogenes]PNU01419.1 hypothetical protein CDQ84_01780 [Pseudoclostridium thermosuccinogenes]
MDLSEHIICPVCKGKSFKAKYEATYVYSYVIDSDAPGLRNREEFLPFLFDNREQKEARQYVECDTCGARFPCQFSHGNKGIDFTILQKAFRSDYVEKPEFLG